ncbi:MAG: TonB-dependent receptor [Leadbetterella sp.]|nr:TonB-dependent receptor [Leadbetterella sp.]
MTWSVAYALATGNTPDWVDGSITYRNSVEPDGTVTPSATFIDPLTHIWTRNRDQDLSAYMDWDYNLFSNLDLSAGGMYRIKRRNNFYTSYTLNTILPGGERQIFTSYDKVLFNFFPESTAYADTTNGNNYDATENISAGYVQGKWLVANGKLQILGGVRVEQTGQTYESQLPVTLEGKTGTISYRDVLPSLNLKYMIDRKKNLRFSYFKAISRPAYFEYVPAAFPGDYFNESGNYNLKHTEADNVDLRFEVFPSAHEQLFVGGFYKRIKNPIEWGFSSGVNKNLLYMPQNFGTATNYGLELVFAKFIRQWGITGNYTFTKSAITTTKRVYYRDAQGNIQNAPPATAEYPTPPTQTRPLQGQSAHIANLSLIYKNTQNGLDAQLSSVYTGKRINVVSPYKDLDYWQRATTQLDFSIEKRLGKHLGIFSKITNLLNSPLIVEIMKPNTFKNLPEQTRDDRVLVQKDVFGRGYMAGIRYKLN